MRKTHTSAPTILVAADRWQRSRVDLSAPTHAAYAGEIRRFAEYLAKVGVYSARDITEDLWDNYLKTLLISRLAVDSRRRIALKSSSALQAGRITRAFLRYCWQQEWLAWLPPQGSYQGSPRSTTKNYSFPVGLESVLLDDGAGDDEASARKRCAIGLAFWGALNPQEISALKRSDLRRDNEGSWSVHPKTRSSIVVLPAILIRQLQRYDHIRAARQSRMQDDVAVICRLNSAQPLSSGSVWRLLTTWTVGVTTAAGSLSLGSRTLRDSFQMLASVDAGVQLAALKQQTGRSRSIYIYASPNQDAARQITQVVYERLQNGGAMA